MSNKQKPVILAFLILLLLGKYCMAQPTGGFGELRTGSTIYSISIEQDITGDNDHDAVCKVQYRVNGSSVWNNALPLMRVDFSEAVTRNMMAGSIMFLEPGTEYEIRLDYLDPDGGSRQQEIRVATQPLPVKPSTGNVYYVEPGSGGGDGSSINAFKGIAAAQAVAQPGDIFLLKSGDYGGRVSFEASGDSGKYIVWQAAGDGVVTLSGIEVHGSYNWFEGLTITVVGDNCPAISTYGDSSANTPHDIVIKGNHVSSGNSCSQCYIGQCGLPGARCSEYVIRGKRHAKYWYIADNIIVGNIIPNDSLNTICGEGIDMGYHNSSQTGHTIAHNMISHTADAISYVGGNADIFGNEIIDVADDGIEPDYASANVRIWGNRITNAMHNAISLQDFENGMPWYIVRNQIISYQENVLKANSPPGYYAFYHNTIVNWDHIFYDWNSEMTLYGVAKNNIMATMVLPDPSYGRHFWSFKNSIPDWRGDFDYNAYDFEQTPSPFYFMGRTYQDLVSYRSASGFDNNSFEIEKETCFENLNYSGPSPTPVPLQYLTLKQGCTAIDAGVVLPNINDGYSGVAPDIGAYEIGAPLPQYGPRMHIDTIPAAPSGLTVSSK